MAQNRLPDFRPASIPADMLTIHGRKAYFGSEIADLLGVASPRTAGIVAKIAHKRLEALHYNMAVIVPMDQDENPRSLENDLLAGNAELLEVLGRQIDVLRRVHEVVGAAAIQIDTNDNYKKLRVSAVTGLP